MIYKYEAYVFNTYLNWMPLKGTIYSTKGITKHGSVLIDKKQRISNYPMYTYNKLFMFQQL